MDGWTDGRTVGGLTKNIVQMSNRQRTPASQLLSVLP